MFVKILANSISTCNLDNEDNKMIGQRFQNNH
jgi:hypothetical protein